MGLYSKYLDFPKKLRQGYFIVTIVFLYMVFSMDLSTLLANYTVDFRLFNNDFTQECHLSWFVNIVLWFIFDFVCFRAATAMIKNKLIKSIFYALSIDAIFSIANIVIFGDFNPVASILVRNIFVILALIYSYFILPHTND